ncbi:MAG: transcriptional repressor LexA [Leptospirillia bacterium]
MDNHLPTPLTPRQRQTLDSIRRHIAAHGMPPTRAEIATDLGVSSANAAEGHLRALAKKGAISLTPGASRGIRIADTTAGTDGPPPTGTDPSVMMLPVRGNADGSTSDGEATIEARIPVPASLFFPRPDHLLRVPGQDMKDAGILAGDLLAVHCTESAENGTIVVARREGELIVRRFERHGHWVLLLPENPEYAPIKTDMRRTPLVIEGLGVGVIRRVT